jgi:hypothetical protein
VEDPEETPGRRVMIRIRIRSDPIPFNLKFVIKYFIILLFVWRNCGKIPIYYPFSIVFIILYPAKYPFNIRLCGKYPYSFLLSVFLLVYKPTICLAYKLGIRFLLNHKLVGKYSFLLLVIRFLLNHKLVAIQTTC